MKKPPSVRTTHDNERYRWTFLPAIQPAVQMFESPHYLSSDARHVIRPGHSQDVYNSMHLLTYHRIMYVPMYLFSCYFAHIYLKFYIYLSVQDIPYKCRHTCTHRHMLKCKSGYPYPCEYACQAMQASVDVWMDGWSVLHACVHICTALHASMLAGHMHIFNMCIVYMYGCAHLCMYVCTVIQCAVLHCTGLYCTVL